MSYRLREYHPQDPQDAEKLAAMWNASESGWPGGWTRGIPYTAERIREEQERHNRLAVLVVEHQNEIVGYGDLAAQPGQQEVAYLPLLNVRPDHQGRGLGKQLLLALLNRTIELGYKQLALGTWAGNTRAVPLYKKVGFFWVPETNVHMQNFLPTVLTLPVARDFFARHDWYSCFRRDLSVQPDDIRWHGIPVFPYEFVADGEILKVIIDRHAERVTAVETQAFGVHCFTGLEEVPTGLEHTVHWQIERRAASSNALSAVLLAEGEAGIALQCQESLIVQDTVTLERPFTVAPDIPPKEPGEPAPTIRSTVVLDGTPLTLETAVRPVAAIAVEYGGQALLPGKPEKVTVKLRSYVDFPVAGVLEIAPHPQLQWDRLSADFQLEAQSWCGLVFWVTAPEAGVFRTTLTVTGRETTAKGRNSGAASPRRIVAKPKPVSFQAVPVGGLLVDVDEEAKALLVINDRLSLRLERRGGVLSVSDRIRGRWAFSQPVAEIGPPFVGWREKPPTYEVEVAQHGGQVALTLRVPSDLHPGLTLEKRVTMSNGPVLRIDHRVLNATAQPQKFQLRAPLGGSREYVILPTVEGIVRERHQWGTYPVASGDISKEAADYTETWAAWESEGLVLGQIWHESAEREEGDLLFDLPEIGPRSFVDLPPLYLVVEHGSWELVRGWWRRLIQPGGTRELRRPEATRVLTVDFDPAPLLVTEPHTPTRIRLTNRRGREWRGRARVTLEGGQVSPAEFEFSGARLRQPFVQEVTVSTGTMAPRVIPATIALAAEAASDTFETAAVVLGDGRGSVKWDEEGGEEGGPDPARRPLQVVDNGYLVLKVAPFFLGTVVALERHGVNHLRSSFPQAGPFRWFNPWFGGIQPYFNWIGEVRLGTQKFTGEFVQVQGARGLTWWGVRVACEVDHKDYRWLRLEAEYLTLPGSNVVAVIVRAVNRTTGPMGCPCGAAIWTAPGGRYDNTVLYHEEEQKLRQRRRTAYAAELRTGKWALVAPEEAGPALMVVGTDPDHPIEVLDMDADGVHFQSPAFLSLEAEEARSTLTWLVLADEGVEAARPYRVLGQLRELP